MIRILVTLLTFLIISGCSYRYVPVINPEEISRTVLIYAEKLKQDFHLELDDSCIYYDTNVNRIKLIFSSMDTIYLSDARKLLVDVVEGFIPRINENSVI